MKIYNKLVRDRIPEIIEEGGRKAFCHRAEAGEYLEALRAKVIEEVDELYEDPSEEELGDLLEVIYAMGEYYGMDIKKVEEERVKKKEMRGGFRDRIILEGVE